MQDFVDMAEAHAWTLQRLREMAGRLTEQAYQRASEAAVGEAEEAQRWMLVFDRMARGLRLTMALEAKLARERRSDADEIVRAVLDERPAPRRRAPAPDREAEPYEADRERDDDGLPQDAPLAQRIARLKGVVEGADAMAPPRVRYRFIPPNPREAWSEPLPCEGRADAPAWRGSG